MLGTLIPMLLEIIPHTIKFGRQAMVLLLTDSLPTIRKIQPTK